MNGRDVHTEHCCAKNGCKYGEESTCTVWLGYSKQTYGFWDGYEVHPIPVISDEEFKRRQDEADRDLGVRDD